MQKEVLIEAFCEGDKWCGVLACGTSRRILRLPLKIFYQDCESPNFVETLDSFYGAGKKVRVGRVFCTTKSQWRDAYTGAQNSREGSRFGMLNLKPEIAYMIQNCIQLGDVWEDNKWANGDNTFPPLKVLTWDIETTTLNPRGAGAHVITLAYATAWIRGADIEWIRRVILQLGSVDPASPELQQHLRELDAPLYVRAFPCNPHDESSIATAEKQLLLEWSACIDEEDPDILCVSSRSRATRSARSPPSPSPPPAVDTRP